MFGCQSNAIWIPVGSVLYDQKRRGRLVSYSVVLAIDFVGKRIGLRNALSPFKVLGLQEDHRSCSLSTKRGKVCMELAL